MQYRKRTRLWNNLESFKPKELCKKDCGSVRDGKHVATAQRMPNGKKSDWGDDAILFKQDELYRIPAELIHEIFESISVYDTLLMREMEKTSATKSEPLQ